MDVDRQQSNSTGNGYASKISGMRMTPGRLSVRGFPDPRYAASGRRTSHNAMITIYLRNSSWEYNRKNR